MKLAQLTIHNIASLAQATIDFTQPPLRDASLFLIDGETGAGKTTILDAICLALYGNTPRIELANRETVQLSGFDHAATDDDTLKVKDVRQLLRRGTGEGAVTLTFTGNDGACYQAHWEVRRARNRPDGKLQNAQHTLLNLDTRQAYAKKELTAQIEKVVGLNFDQFCRTTLLAQGEFTRFLYSKEDEKASILEKLTGTEQYARIGQMVFTLFDRAKDDYRNKNDELNRIQCLTAEQVAECHAQLTTKKAEQARFKTQGEQLNRRLVWLRDFEGKTAQLKAAQARLEEQTARTQTAAYREENRLVSDYAATEAPRNDLRERDRAHRAYEQEAAQTATYQNQYFALLAGNRALEREIDQHEQQKAQLDQAVTAAQAQVASSQKQVDAKAVQIASLKQQRDALRPDELKTSNRAVTAQINLCDKASYAHADIAKARQAQAEAVQELNNHNQALDAQRKQAEELKGVTAQRERDFEVKDAVYQKLSLSVADWAREARRHLKAGDTCPVCGQKVTAPLHDDDFKSLLAAPEREREQADKALRQAMANEQGALKQVKTLERELPRLQQKADRAARACADSEKALQRLCADIDGLTYDPASDGDFTQRLTALQEALRSQQEALEQQLAQVDAQNKRIEDENAALAQLQTALSRAERDKAASERAQRDNLSTLASQRDLLGHCAATRDTLAHVAGQWQPAAGQTARPVAVARLQAAWTDFATQVARWQQAMSQYARTRDEKQQAIDAFLVAHGEVDLARLRDLASRTAAQIEALKASHKAVDDAIAQATGSIKTLRQQLDKAQEERPVEQEPFTQPQLQAAIDQCALHKDEADRSIAQIEMSLKQNAESQKRRVQVQKEVVQLQKDYERWNEFNNLFGSKDGKKFKMIAQSFILGHLLDLANYYLEQFAPRFTLTRGPGSLVILVTDKYQPDKPFSSNTLSGGESFLVSLSLALALSQLNTSSNAVDTLFIDEGFGTLDGDYLNAVMDALGKLHQVAGRRVGIISHVEVLSQLITTQIQVRRVNPTQSALHLVPAQE